MEGFTQGTVYYDGNVDIQKGTEFGWQRKIIKAGSIFYCAYTVDNNDIEVRVSKSSDGINWVDTNFPQTLSNGNSNLWPSMTVDNTNKIHLCFNKDGYNKSNDGTAKIVYTTYTEGIGWGVFEELSPIGHYFGYPVINIDKNNKPHISYGSLSGDGEIFYTNKISGSWLGWENLDTNLVIQEYFTKIFVDSNNVVSVFCCASDSSYQNYAIYRIYGVSESWNTELIIPGGNIFYLDVEIDNSENFHIVGYNSKSNIKKLEYYRKVGAEYSLIASSNTVLGIPFGVNIGIANNNIIHVVYDGLHISPFGYKGYYTKIENDSFIDLVNLGIVDAIYNSIYVDENTILIVTSDFDDYEYIYSFVKVEEEEKPPILIPNYRGRIMICEYQRTITAEAGTSSTAIICTAHDLNDADMIVNLTRKSTSLAGMERASRKIVVDDEDTLLFSDGVPLLGQTAGDEIMLYKYIDRTDLVKIGSLNIGLQTGNKGEASFELIIPIE